MIAAFFIGVLVGIGAVCLVASWYASKPKSQAASVTPGAIGVDMNAKGGISQLDVYHKRMLESVLKHYEGKA
jgi:hypothetical protein